MNIQEFVSESLKQVVSGISDAQSALSNVGATVNPAKEVRSPMKMSEVQKAVKSGSPRPKQETMLVPKVMSIEFDIAVTVTTSRDEGGKAGLGIQILSAGLSTSTSNETSSVNRIRFTVPFVSPVPQSQN